jgi:D-glucuronyl C5-epimerase C-terminus
MKRDSRRPTARLALVIVVALGGLSLGHGSTPSVAASTSVETHGGHEFDAANGSTTRSDPATRPARKASAAPVLTSVAVPWQSTSFTIRDLAPAHRFEIVHRQPSTAWPPTAVHDSHGVPMRIIGGYRRYHPVGLARLGLKYLYSFRRTGDPLYLDRAERIAAGLQRIAVSARGAIWFPYRFTFTMHGDGAIVNRPPWFSGMAQGLALSLFVRLWERTGNDAYRVLADLTYNSLRNLGRASTYWVSWVAAGRYLWIEEYPRALDRTFNGHVFALFGLYDYFQLTKDRGRYSAARNANVLSLLRGGITTIRAFASTFRNRGTVSDYCLAHHFRNPKYHAVHIGQLRQLGRITGDAWFGRMADLFASDTR